jgi:polyhydroxyalkanoate synthase subunit PhaC
MISRPGIVEAARGIVREVDRTQLRARKGIKLIADRPPPRTAVTPKDEVWALGKARLWRYRNPDIRHHPPLMLFLGLVGDSSIFDLHPGNSWAEFLVAEGFDVFLFDWGCPTPAEGDHTLETYLDGYLVHAADAVCRAADSAELAMGAYCMGALMALLLLGSRDDVPASRLVLFSPPCNFDPGPPMARVFIEGGLAPVDLIDATTGLVPASAVRAMFRLSQPTSDIVQYVNLWEHLWRDDYVEPHRAINHWAWNHRAIAGPAFCQLIQDYVRGNALMRGTVRLGGRAVRLGQITVPTLLVIADRDELVPPASSEPLRTMIGTTSAEVLRVAAGHAGALMGSAGIKVTMPGVIEWLACN